MATLSKDDLFRLLPGNPASAAAFMKRPDEVLNRLVFPCYHCIAWEGNQTYHIKVVNV